MSGLHKFRLKNYCFVYATVACLCAITFKTEARRTSASEIYSTLTQDTIPQPSKRGLASRLRIDSTGARRDTSKRDSVLLRDTIPGQPVTDTFSLKLSKDTLDAPVNYEAADSGVLLVKEKKFLLYGKTKTTYKEITLTAPRVVLDQATSVVTALSSRDSLGLVDTRAEFSQGTEKFQSDTITYNFKTQRGLTVNTYTRQNDMWMQGKFIKKVDANTTFAKEIIMTTCDYDDPHFGFKANKAKFVNNKVAITGPVHPEFEGIPIPFYLPFGFFPLNPGRHSGFIPPQFSVTQNQGIGLVGMGYYHVVNDYLDVMTKMDIFSYGAINVYLSPSYYRRYKYRGGFNLSWMRAKENFKGDPDYFLSNAYNIRWNHQMESKARPGVNFQASVDLGSTKANRFIPNNPVRNVLNTQTSSITYSKTWIGTPFNLTASANQNQNSGTNQWQISLPNLTFTMASINPFQRKVIVGKERWYEKIGIGYNGTYNTTSTFIDTLPNVIRRMLDTLQWGAQHSFPLATSLPPLFGGKLIVSPGISYRQTWLQTRVRRTWNAALNKEDTISIKKGLFTDHGLQFSLALNTAVYGTKYFKKSKLVALRHVMRPSVALSYQPNLSRGKFDEIIDNSGYKRYRSQFDGNLFGLAGSNQTFAGMSFTLDNNLEMKWKGKKDSVARKVSLIDGFGFSFSYNFLKDSLKLNDGGDINVYVRSTLFNKLSITGNIFMNPYQFDPNLGRIVNRFVWEDGFRLGRITSASVAMSTQFKSKPRNPQQAPNQNAALGRRLATDPMLGADAQRLQDYMLRNPAEFVDFNIPWSIDLAFSLNMSKNFNFSDSTFRTDLSSSIQFNNSFSLTPKWNFSTTGNYDLKNNEMTMFTMSVSRDMHCWQMAIQVTPIGTWRSFNITISPKSAILQDLKVNRTRVFTNF